MEQRKLYPKLFEAVLSLVGGQLTGGEVLSEFEYHDGQTPPSQAEADAELAVLMSEYEAEDYARKREGTYPALGEQLDMLFHDMTADKGSKTGEWYKAIAKVKSNNPK